MIETLVCLIVFAAFCLLWPVFTDRPADRQRNEALERDLSAAHAAEVVTDSIKRFHLLEHRAELTALWDEQIPLIYGFHRGAIADWYLDRMWRRNRDHWSWIIAAKGRIVPDEMSA